MYAIRSTDPKEPPKFSPHRKEPLPRWWKNWTDAPVSLPRNPPDAWAETQSGADLLLDLCEFDTLLTHTDLVITGEGHADRQTLMGKLPERVMRRAQAQHVPVWLVAGKASDAESLLNAGFSRVDSLTPDGMPLEEAIRPEVARKNIHRWVETVWNQLKK